METLWSKKKNGFKWKCERDPLPVKLPEGHKPGAQERSCAGWNADLTGRAPMEGRASWNLPHYAVAEDACEQGTVIGTESTHEPVEECMD